MIPKNKKNLLQRIAMIILFFSVLIPFGSVDALPLQLKVGLNINTPPFQYAEADVISGLYVDIMDAISRECGFTVEYVPFQNTNAAMDALNNHEVDAVLGVVPNKYQQRSALFTNEIYTTSLCFVDDIRSEAFANNLSKPTVVLESDTIEHSYLNNEISSYTVLKDNQLSAFHYFKSGKADIFAVLRETALYLIDQEGNDSYRIENNYVATVRHSIALREEDMFLLSTINVSIAKIHTSGEYEAIVERWVATEQPAVSEEVMKKICISVAAVLLFALLWVYYSQRTKHKLEAEVEARTADLKTVNAQIQEINGKLERRLEENEEYARLLNDIIESSSSAMMLLDDRLHVIHCNKYATVFINQYLKNATLRDLVHQIFQNYKRSLSLENAYVVHNKKLDIEFSDGSTHVLRYSIHFISKDDAEFNYLVSLEDITVETIEQESEYEREKNHVLNNMIGGIAHEIKNPLTAISAAVSLVKTKRYDDDFVSTFDTAVPQEIERINRLIKNLVSYAKPAKAVSERLDLSELLGNSSLSVRPFVESNGITLETNIEKGMMLSASRDKINQIILNLIMNSVESFKNRSNDFADLPPTIRLSAFSAGAVITLIVWDNGIGMTEDQIERCFQPFYTTKKVGTGLGLAISSQYIAEISGTISIHSEPNQYTKVTIQLPKSE